MSSVEDVGEVEDVGDLRTYPIDSPISLEHSVPAKAGTLCYGTYLPFLELSPIKLRKPTDTSGT